MPVRYKQLLRFSKRLRVDQAMLSYVVSQAATLGAKFHFATLSGRGTSHQINSGVELKALTSDDISKAVEIVVFFTSKTGKWRIGLNRLSLPGSTYFHYPSRINSSSSHKNFAYSLVGLRAQIELLFEDKESPDLDRFTSSATTDASSDFAELEEPPIVFDPRSLDSSAEVAQIESPRPTPEVTASISLSPPPLKKRLHQHAWFAPGVVIAALTVILGLFQYRTGARQATSSEHQSDTGDRQLLHQGSALFKAKRIEVPLTTEVEERLLKHREERFSLEIQNLGPATATNVHVRCGGRDEHGPYADIGTIPTGPPLTINGWVSADKNDALHQHDYLCGSAVYLLYEDQNGKHTISFDSAGNAVTITE